METIVIGLQLLGLILILAGSSTINRREKQVEFGKKDLKNNYNKLLSINDCKNSLLIITIGGGVLFLSMLLSFVLLSNTDNSVPLIFCFIFTIVSLYIVNKRVKG